MVCALRVTSLRAPRVYGTCRTRYASGSGTAAEEVGELGRAGRGWLAHLLQQLIAWRALLVLGERSSEARHRMKHLLRCAPAASHRFGSAFLRVGEGAGSGCRHKRSTRHAARANTVPLGSEGSHSGKTINRGS